MTTRDFTVVRAADDAEIKITATGAEPLRLAIVEVPSEVDYPLDPK